jgi:hypothetical protein
MAGWTTDPSLANTSDVISDTSVSQGINIITGDVNTYGSWSEVNASIPYDVTHLLVQPNSSGNASATVAYSIAAAPAGSEPLGVIIQDLVFQSWAGPISESILLPVGPLKAGSRIAVQSASGVAFDASNIALAGFDCGRAGPDTGGSPAVWDTYGWTGTGAIQGVTVDPGDTANTKGAYATVASSVTYDLRGFFLGFDFQGNLPGTLFDNHPLLVDLSLGAAGGEQVLIPNLLAAHLFGSDGTIQMAGVSPSFTPTFLMPIKAGTRVAVRAQAYSSALPDRLFGVSLYGLRA